MAGNVASPWEAYNNQKTSPIGPSTPNMPYGSPSNFQAAASTQASDYDKIMAGYDNLIKSSGLMAGRNQATYTPTSPALTQYSPSANTTSAMSNLSSLSASGGYSPENIANIRARGVSPIRSIYANAQRNLDRNKALSGGYSPNYAAASGKMAREMSEQIGGANTNIEAGIAENQAKNRLAIAPSFASFAGDQDRMRMASETGNAEAINRTNEQNQNLALQYTGMNNQLQQNQQGNILAAIEAKRGLYGTTPALTGLFGNQVAQAANLGQNQQEINNQKKQTNFGVASSMFR